MKIYEIKLACNIHWNFKSYTHLTWDSQDTRTSKTYEPLNKSKHSKFYIILREEWQKIVETIEKALTELDFIENFFFLSKRPFELNLIPTQTVTGQYISLLVTRRHFFKTN